MSNHADRSSSVPAEAERYLTENSPRLTELRHRYANIDWPCRTVSTWWAENRVADVELTHFRGDNPFIWHYRELLPVTELKYLVYAQYIRSRDSRNLLEVLGEDGAFGCWTFRFPGLGEVSRDLLDSLNELYFLDRHLGVLGESAKPRRILDIGAGYGRLAHRAAKAVPNLTDYVCVDAIPESTFLSEFYLGYREASPPARVIELPEVADLAPGDFDLAINVHSFSECTSEAVEWWMGQLARLEIPHLFLVPNESEGYLTRETDGTRRDYGTIIEAAGYSLAASERAIQDEAVRAQQPVDDRYEIFSLHV